MGSSPICATMVVISGNEKPPELCWIIRYVDGRFEAAQRWIENKHEVVFKTKKAAQATAQMLNAGLDGRVVE